MVFDADRAERLGNEGEKIILTRIETKPEDIHGFFVAQGILTSRGEKTTPHAAVVARGMGKPCVSGAEGMDINYELKEARIGQHIIKEGDIVTIDGGAGAVYLGAVPMVDPKVSEDLVVLLKWADKISRLEVGPMPIPRIWLPRPGNMVLKASACAAPSACSTKATACPWCAA